MVVHNGQTVGAPHVAEHLGVPCVLGLTVPMHVPTREFAWPGVALPGGLPGALNRASYLGMRAPAVMFGRTVDRWRRDALGCRAGGGGTTRCAARTAGPRPCSTR